MTGKGTMETETWKECAECARRFEPQRRANRFYRADGPRHNRVSTDKQGKSGLGIQAQRKAVEDYLNGGRERVDYIVVLSKAHLRRILQTYARYTTTSERTGHNVVEELTLLV
jgi:hypothetical protein